MRRAREKRSIFMTTAFGVIVAIMMAFAVFSIFVVSSVGSGNEADVFNYSFMSVSSLSMETSSLEQGDVVLVKKVNISQIKEGDSIALYYNPNSQFLGDSLIGSKEMAKDYQTGMIKSYQNQFSVCFRTINDISYDEEGNTYIQVADENGNVAQTYTKADLVIGISREANMYSFFSQNIGVFITICSIIGFLFVWYVIEITNKVTNKYKRQAEYKEAVIPTNRVLNIIEVDGDFDIK